MHFYRLTHPEYTTDHAADVANPIRMVNEFYVPGIVCSVCGESWASSDRVRVPVPMTSDLRTHLMGKVLSEKEWYSFAAKLRHELSIPSWMRVTPGAQIGLPKGELYSCEVPDLMHPFPGQIIARSQVIRALAKEQVSGFYPVQVQTTWAERIRRKDAETPGLYELLIMGNAWHTGKDTCNTTVCTRCGRTSVPSTTCLDIDIDRWDGSDFFHVDQNTNIVLVTERVCTLFAEYEFTNFRCISVS